MTTASYKLQMLSSTSCTNSGFFPLACRDVAHGGENLINARKSVFLRETNQNVAEEQRPPGTRTFRTFARLPNQTFITFHCESLFLGSVCLYFLIYFEGFSVFALLPFTSLTCVCEVIASPPPVLLVLSSSPCFSFPLVLLLDAGHRASYPLRGFLH